METWRGICPIGCDTATHLWEERKQYQVISQYGKTIFVCIYSCSLPKSTKYRTSSIFGTWCFAMLFWNFVLAYFLPLGDSFTVLMRRNCLKVLKLSGNSHWSQYHNITISWYHKITKSKNHKITISLKETHTHNITILHTLEIIIVIISTNNPNSFSYSVCHMISQVPNSLAFPSSTWIGDNGHHVM